jgi:hypothetical protein
MNLLLPIPLPLSPTMEDGNDNKELRHKYHNNLKMDVEKTLSIKLIALFTRTEACTNYMYSHLKGSKEGGE